MCCWFALTIHYEETLHRVVAYACRPWRWHDKEKHMDSRKHIADSYTTLQKNRMEQRISSRTTQPSRASSPRVVSLLHVDRFYAQVSGNASDASQGSGRHRRKDTHVWKSKPRLVVCFLINNGVEKLCFDSKVIIWWPGTACNGAFVRNLQFEGNVFQ